MTDVVEEGFSEGMPSNIDSRPGQMRKLDSKIYPLGFVRFKS